MSLVLRSFAWASTTLLLGIGLAFGLQSDEQKVAYLIAVENEVPELFESVKRYEMDLPGLIEGQGRLTRQFEKDPEYLRLKKERPGLARVRLFAQDPSPKAEVDPVVLSQLKRKWSAELTAEVARGQTSIQRELKGLLQLLGRVDSNRLVTGLIKALPPERQKAAFPLSFEEKIILLKRELPRDLQAAGFKAEVFGLNKEIDSTRVLTILRQAKLAEDRLPRLVSSLLLANQNLLADEKTSSKTFEFLNERGQARIKSLVASELKGLYRVGTAQEFLDLREVPPDWGILRGCVGGDCSTRRSYAYPNSPMERVFFVSGGAVSEKPKLKGYVAGTHVVVEGRPAFYVHTVAGRDFNGRDLDKILDLFFSQKAALGAERIIVPTKQRIQSNLFDHPKLKEVYEQKLQNLPDANIRHPDEALRAVIDRAVPDSSYDTSSSNARGYIYSPKEAIRLETRVKAVSSEAVVTYAVDGSNKGRALGLALERKLAGDEQILALVKNATGLTDSAIQSALAILYNKRALPIAEYSKQANSLLKAYAINANQFFRKHGAYQILARLLAPDSFNSENLAITKKMFREFEADPFLFQAVKEFILEAGVTLPPANIRSLGELAQRKELGKKVDWLLIDVVFKDGVPVQFAELADQIVLRADRLTLNRMHGSIPAGQSPNCLVKALGLVF
ncbi:MAG TPA: hypothetical protein DCS07_01785 [Bdellovibrionales bacterium]|nr:MAG: hypothetical protein A2Z97_00335 [Bdellovibrionales bacterium GWB1_52_6]OFZ05865.1 MAG: hypothetical protein A2X97_12510 [Bdellovibrionales bacterium GWA1_52_35]OFZ37055.1 MAG: hypothetical protein A2070_09085 [Bdellovibrionales bacterium GWC1_52_8]HAR41355.1 hypothetical protein [Bdellovibrionales bacterium]HCM39755.1 hypothetical protein [Bdellovibrionales bacterium]